MASGVMNESGWNWWKNDSPLNMHLAKVGVVKDAAGGGHAWGWWRARSTQQVASMGHGIFFCAKFVGFARFCDWCKSRL